MRRTALGLSRLARDSREQSSVFQYWMVAPTWKMMMATARCKPSPGQGWSGRAKLDASHMGLVG